MLNQFIYSIVGLSFFGFSATLIGSFILKRYTLVTGFIFRSFVASIIGLVSILLLYATYKSGGKTVLITLLPLIGLFIWHYKGQQQAYSITKPSLINSLKSALFVGLLCVPFFCFQLYFFYNFQENQLIQLHGDHYLYGEFAQALQLFGSENKFTEASYFFPEFRTSLVPYHYPELWLSSLASELLPISTVFAYYLFTLPLLMALFFVGLSAFFKTIFHKKRYSFLAAGGSLFVSGVFFTVFENYEFSNYSYWADNGVLSLFSQKLAFQYLIGFLSFLLFYKQKQNSAILVLLSLGIFNISYLPACIGATGLLVVYKWWKNKFSLHQSQLKLLLGAISTTIGIALFYFIFKSEYSSSVVGNDVFLSKLLTNSFSFLDLKIFVGNSLFRTGRAILFYIPFAPIILVTFRQLKQLWLLVLLMLFVGLITSCLLYNVMDAMQFMSNVLIFVNFMLIFSIGILFKQRTKFNRILVGYCIVIVSYTAYYSLEKRLNLRAASDFDAEFIRTFNELNKHSNSPILVFMAAEDFKNIPFAWWQLKNNLLIANQAGKKTALFSLGNPELYFKQNSSTTHADSLYYQNFTPLELHRQKTGKETLLSFTEKYNIKFCYFKPGSIVPEEISQRAIKRIYSTKNEQIIQLKN